MKKEFTRERGILFDETIKTGFASTCFTLQRKRLPTGQKEKFLADLGSGSETEYQSAASLYRHQDKSPQFLDWLIECCEREDTYLNSGLCWALINFRDDARVLPAIFKSVSKCPDEDLGNYPGLLEVFGGKEAKDILKERFHKLKDNPLVFTRHKDWNNLAFSLLDICEVLLKFEPDNIEAAECLIKLSKHPNLFNREIAVGKLSAFFKDLTTFRYDKIKKIFREALESLSRTNNSRLFGILLPYLFQYKPEQTYQKFKKFYLKTRKEDRYYNLAFNLIYFVENPLPWISRLVRELPAEDSEYFRDYLNLNRVKAINNEELILVVEEDLASESPNKRASAINKLKDLDIRDARRVLEVALIDEPDEFIKKLFEKYLEKLKKQNKTG